jgi:predicted ATPase/DNA-binding CsgD family transcriptional regulator
MVRMASRTPGNLPAEVTSLVGRREETTEVRSLLSASRLVTLTGPGGVGKTRLALHVGRMARADFPDGAWFAPLAELGQPDLLESTLMSSLGVADRTGPIDLPTLVGERRLLLILDNYEHLVESVAVLASRLLRRCANLRILATSQEPLRADGETLFPVPPLPVPDASVRVDRGSGARYDAVSLFLERAAAANPGRTIDAEHELAVIELCRRVDGLPLAIELAAAGTRVLPFEALMESVVGSGKEITTGSRTAPTRHQTLRATMDYSHSRCSESSRELWARLSVFRGGAELNSIEAVCAISGQPTGEVRSSLAELVDKSVLSFDGRRYRMLEPIRGYGGELLAAHGWEHQTRAAHLEHFGQLAAELDDGWCGPDQSALLSHIIDEQANVRAALDFTLTDPARGIQGIAMAAALWPFWIGCGLLAEGRHWLDRLLATERAPTRERVSGLWVDGLLTATSGDIEESLAMLDESQRLAEQLHDASGHAHATQMLGLAELLSGRPDRAIAHLEAAVELERLEESFNPYLAFALVNLGSALCFDEQLERASAALEEARELCAARGEQLLLSWSLVHLGLAALRDNRARDAHNLLREGLVRKRALEDTLGITFAIELLAWAAHAEGDPLRGARLLGAGEAMSESLSNHLAGLPRMIAWHEANVREMRDALGPRRFDAASKAGRRLSTNSAIDYALGVASVPERPSSDPLSDLPLTPREREIAALVATGKTNKEIAAELVVAHRTVSTHVEHILAKLNFRSRTQVARLFGMDGGKLTPDDRG